MNSSASMQSWRVSTEKSKTKISAKFENYAKQKIIFEAFLAAVVVIWKSDGFPVQKERFFSHPCDEFENFLWLCLVFEIHGKVKKPIRTI